MTLSLERFENGWTVQYIPGLFGGVGFSRVVEDPRELVLELEDEKQRVWQVRVKEVTK